jgi:hypothetical protein
MPNQRNIDSQFFRQAICIGFVRAQHCCAPNAQTSAASRWNFKALDFLPPRRKLQAVYEANHQQNRTPPDVGVQVKEHNRIRGRMKHLPDSGAGNQHSIHQQGDPNKKPDRNAAFTMHDSPPVFYH